MIVTIILLKLYYATVRITDSAIQANYHYYSHQFTRFGCVVCTYITQKGFFSVLFPLLTCSRCSFLPSILVARFIIELKRKTVQLRTMVSSPRAHSGNRNLFNAVSVCVCVFVFSSSFDSIIVFVVCVLMLLDFDYPVKMDVINQLTGIAHTHSHTHATQSHMVYE